MKTLERMDGKLFESLQSKEMSNLASIVGGDSIFLTTSHVYHMVDIDGGVTRITANDKQKWTNDGPGTPYLPDGPEIYSHFIPAGNVIQIDKYVFKDDGSPM